MYNFNISTRSFLLFSFLLEYINLLPLCKCKQLIWFCKTCLFMLNAVYIYNTWIWRFSFCIFYHLNKAKHKYEEGKRRTHVYTSKHTRILTHSHSLSHSLIVNSFFFHDFYNEIENCKWTEEIEGNGERKKCNLRTNAIQTNLLSCGLKVCVCNHTKTRQLFGVFHLLLYMHTVTSKQYINITIWSNAWPKVFLLSFFLCMIYCIGRWFICNCLLF